MFFNTLSVARYFAGVRERGERHHAEKTARFEKRSIGQSEVDIPGVRPNRYLIIFNFLHTFVN